MQRMTGTAVKTGVLALALALTGCGGGGGGGNSSPAPDAPVAQRTVQGTAAKGLIKGAKVSVHAIDAQGVRASALLASTTTASDGTYKVQVPVSVRNFVIEVSTAPGAVMADEASGADLPFPDAMKLRSVVTLAETATGAYEGTVSPLTEMVARTAQTLDGKLPPQAVAQAKASVRTLLGFDPETVKPVNSNSVAAISASEDEKNQSLALAAISKMAGTASADCAQSNAGERMSCVVTKLAGSVTVKDGQPGLDPARLAQFRAAIEAVALDKTINRTGKDKVVGIPVLTPAPVTPPAPPVGETPTPLAATKALFGSLRTNLRSIGEGDAFRATADAVKRDLVGALAPFGNDFSGFATLAMDALERLDRYRTGEIVREGFTVGNYRVLDTQPLRTSVSFSGGDGDCTITASPLSISCTVLQEALLPRTSPVNYNIVYATRTLTLQPKPGSTRDFTYTSFVEKREVAYNGYRTVGTPTRALLGSSFSGDMTYARNGDTVTQFAVKGRMPGRTERGIFQSDVEDWSLNVVRTEETAGIVLYRFGGAVTATAGQSVRKIEVDDTSFLRVTLHDSNNNVLPDAANELQVTLRGTVGGTTARGTLRVAESKQDKSGATHVPTLLSFEGALEHDDATVFNGSVALTRNGYERFDATAAESDTNFVADTVDLGGSLSLPNRPTLSLTLGATRTGKDTADLSAQYRDGSAVVNASVTARAGEPHPLVKVSSADGVAFSFTTTSVPLQVIKDGAVTALLDLSKGIINYSDGSTESLK